MEPILINFDEVARLLGLRSQQAIRDRLRTDPSFPRPVRVAPHRSQFVYQEIVDFIANAPRVEFDGQSAVAHRQANPKKPKKTGGAA